MFDEEAVANRWILRSLKLAVAAGVVLLGGWWLTQMRPLRVPPKKPSDQQLAILRNHAEKELARRIAAEAIDEADVSILGELTTELSSGDVLGRELAAIALGRLEAQAEGAVDALIAALDDPEQGVRLQAAVALGSIGARPVEVAAALAQSVRDDDSQVRGAVFRALRRLGDAGIQAVAGMFADADADIRRRAVIELGDVGGGETNLLDGLRGCLHDLDPRVRAEAQASLWRRSATRIEELIAALGDADPLVRSTACTLLGRMSDEAQPAVPDLIKVLANNDTSGWQAERALEAIGKEDDGILSMLLALLDGDHELTAARAARLLGGFRPAPLGVRERLLGHIEDPRSSVAASAIAALRQAGLETALRPPELIEALEAAGDDVLSLLLSDDQTMSLRRWGMPAHPGNGRGVGFTDQDLARLAGLQRLRLLDVTGNPVGDAGLKQISRFRDLEWLILYNTKATSAGLAHLTKLTKLRSLSLGGCEITDDGLDHLQKMSTLEALDLRKTQVTDAGMSRLAGLARLKAIWLDDTQVTDAGLAHLKDLPLLEEIGIRPKQFTLRGLAQLKGLLVVWPRPESVIDDDLALLAGMPRLRTLLLMRSGVTDAGLAHVGKLTRLELLDLDDTAITDAGLAQLGSLGRLKNLWLANTPATEVGREALARALPHLKSRLVPDKVQPAMMAKPYKVVGLRADDESAAVLSP